MRVARPEKVLITKAPFFVLHRATVSLLDYAKQLLFEHRIAFEPDKVPPHWYILYVHSRRDSLAVWPENQTP